MSQFLQNMQSKHLQWFPEKGVGYFPVTESPYDAAYFDKYKQMEETAIGKRLLSFRLSFVSQHIPMALSQRTMLVDIGIGSGAFVSAANCWGYDINPKGVDWLVAEGRYKDPYQYECFATCFWDSLEHIKDIEKLLTQVRKYVFVSIPIFRDCEHVLSSKHFRKDEHCWYFTEDGFIRFMHQHGFSLLQKSDAETIIGREDILSFAFARNP